METPREYFHAKMDTIKDRNRKKLIEEEEEIKKWQEHTEDLYRKGLNDPDSHNGVVTHLEPDIAGSKLHPWQRS